MAVRFSGTGQTYSVTTGLPPDFTSFTILCWAYLASDRNAVSGFWGMAEAGSGWYALHTTSDGTTVQMTTSVEIIGSVAMSVGTWYRFAAVSNSNNTGILYYGAAGAALSSSSGSYSSVGFTGSLQVLRIGCNKDTTSWVNGKVAAFKSWSAALTATEIAKELEFYQPQRTSNLLRWHPFVSAEQTDYSGLGRTLSGGSGTATEAGPPIAWRRCRTLNIPWATTTQVWYAVYDTTSGELISTGTVLPGSIPSGQAYKEYLGGQPDLSIYEWDTTARDFVLRSGSDLVDRVADMVTDASLASVWATLDPTQDTALQDRIGQLLGPYRYRTAAQDVNLS